MQDLIIHRLTVARQELLARVEAACRRVHRDPGEVELVAVSKTQPPEVICAAHAAGQSVFGENRVQELMAKVPECPSRLSWHFIGHLQSNKIRKVLPLCTLIHSVDSLELARAIERVAEELGLFPSILLEVNVSGESSKFGLRAENVFQVAEEVLRMKRLGLCGLMTIAPLVEDPQAARPYFRDLRQLRDHCAARLGVELPQISMGMSGDFEVAIEEGATLIRLGTAFFGSRHRPQDDTSNSSCRNV